MFISRIVGFTFNYMDRLIISSFLGAAAIGIGDSPPTQWASSVSDTAMNSALLPEITRRLEQVLLSSN